MQKHGMILHRHWRAANETRRKSRHTDLTWRGETCRHYCDYWGIFDFMKKKDTGVLLLKNFKKKSGLTWPEVAKLLGISASYVGNLASGARRITPYLRMLIENPNLRDL